jgi:hypothetical protein
MQFLRLAEVETADQDRVFRSSPTRAGLVAVIVLGIGAALLIVNWEGRTRSGYYLAYYIAGLLFLGLVLLRRFFFARLRPSNWLVRMTSEGLFIQYRSYLNYDLPTEDPTVIFIPYQDICSVRRVLERFKILAQDGPTERRFKMVELELAGDMEPLSKALTAESRSPAPREKTWYGYTSTLYNHHLVRMASPPFLQIEWSAVPGAKNFLNALSPYTRVTPPIVVTQDLRFLETLNREEQQKRLRDLDQRGETITAVYVASKLYGYSLNEAQVFVASLR